VADFCSAVEYVASHLTHWPRRLMYNKNEGGTFSKVQIIEIAGALYSMITRPSNVACQCGITTIHKKRLQPLICG